MKLTVTSLEDFGCPKIEQILGQEKRICKRYSLLLPSHQLLLKCNRKKSKVFFDWIQNDLSNDTNNLISKFGGLRFDSHFRQSIQLFNLNLEELQPQLAVRRQIHLHDQQLPAELKELVKTDNVEEIHLVRATLRVTAHFAVKFKPICNYDKFTKYDFFFIERGVDLLVEPK